MSISKPTSCPEYRELKSAPAALIAAQRAVVTGAATKRVWRSGKPPDIGWWPASRLCDLRTVRWWDGQCWSVAASIHLTRNAAAERAKIKDRNNYANFAYTFWCDRWWE